MLLALTRDVSPRFNECEITHIDRSPIDVAVAKSQHHGYVQALKDLGCAVLELPAEPDLPDSVFVEDAAIVFPEAALVTNPGADSRKPETESISRALAPYREILQVKPPATVDGGDVLVLGRDIYTGMSSRSNREAVDEMNRLLGRFGYQVHGVDLHDCLHLKSAVTRVDDETLLINRKWVDEEFFKGYDLIEVDPSEPFAANCLPIHRSIIYPTTAFPKTAKKLEARGYVLKPVIVDELAKAEGAVTCCSLIVE